MVSNLFYLNWFKKHYAIFVLSVVILFQIANNYFWVRIDKYFPCSDDAEHLWTSLGCYDLFSSFSLSKATYFFRMYSYYPPVFYYISDILYFFFGKSYFVAITTNWLFLIILVFSTYKIGEVLSDKKAGLLSAFIVTTYPAIFGLSRAYMLDFALSAMVALGISLLLCTDNFSNKKLLIILGISLALGMLIKGTFLIFLAFPLGFIIYETSNLLKFRKEKDSFAVIIKDILFALIPGLLIISFWYIPHINNLIQSTKFVISKEGPELFPYRILSLESLTFYINSLINSQISFIYFLIFLAGMVYLITSKIRRKYFLIGSVVIPYLFFTFIALKDARFTVPMLSMLAIISGLAIYNIRNVFFRRVFISLIILYGTISTFYISYGSAKELSIRSFIGKIKLLSNSPDEFCGMHLKPIKSSERIEALKDILDFIDKNNTNPNANSTIIGLISNDKEIVSFLSLRLFAKMHGYPFKIISLCINPQRFISNMDSLNFLISTVELDDLFKQFIDNLNNPAVINGKGNEDIIYAMCSSQRNKIEKINYRKFFSNLKSYSPAGKVSYKNRDIYIYVLNR